MSEGGSIDYKAVFQASPNALLIVAPDAPRFTITDVNDAYLHATGTGRNALIGRALFDAFPDNPDDPAAHATRNLGASLIKVIETRAGDAMPVQKYDIPRAGGGFEKRWWKPLNTPVLDDTGEVTAILHHAADVTAAIRETAEARAALKESQRRYREIVEGAEDFAIVSLDEHGLINSWNNGAERLIGYSEAEALGQPGEIFFTPEDRQAGIPDHEMNRAKTEGRAVNERWHMRKDGSRFWGSGLMMRLDEGEGGYLKMFRDRTAEHQADAALRASEERYRSLFNSIDAGFCTFDMIYDASGRPCDYRFVEVNPAFERHTGLKDAPGRSIREMAPAHEQYWIDLYDRVAVSGAPARVENEAAALDRWYDIYAFKIGAPQERRVAALFNDISERKRSEEALRTSEQRLRAAVLASPFPIMLHAEDGEVLELSRKWIELTGYSRDQIRTHFDWGRLAYPDSFEQFEKLIAEEFATEGEISAGEMIVRATDGSDRIWDFYNVGLGRLPDGRRLQISAATDVTERKAAEEALRVRGEEFYTLADNIPTLCWMAYPDGHIFWYNRRWYDYTGTSPESQEGWGWETVHDPECLPDVVERWSHSLATGTPFEMVFPLKGTDGTFRPFLTRVVPIRDDAGVIVRWFGTNTDITEQRAAEEAARESEARFQAIANSIDQMIWSTRPDGYHDYFNRRWYEYTGVPEGSTDGEEWNGMFHPEDQDRAWETWRHSLATGELYHIEYRLRHRSGQYRWVLGRALPVRGKDGAITRWFGTCTDIQDIVEAREVLARSRVELERLVEERTAERDRLWRNSQDLLVMAETDGTLAAVNRAWTAVLGWEEHELVGSTFMQFTHPDDLAPTLAAFEKIFETPLVDPYEYRLRHKNGDYRWTSWTAAFEDGRIFANGRDVTAEKEAAAELERTQEALRQSQKLEAMGQLTGGVAHDFNNLLSPIIGSLDLLQRRGVGSEREQRLVSGALRSAERAKTLVQRLLAFARRQPLQARAVDIGALVKGMAELIASTSGPQVKVAVNAADGLPPAAADPNQLEMAILNLAVNARDAMPDGGTLSIAAVEEEVGPGHRSKLKPGRYVRLSVADSGTGMDEATLARAIEPFFSTKGIGRGTGLGLSMVHGLASQLGGALAISSRLGLGTSVELWLPVSAQEVEPLDGSSIPISLPNAIGTALLVDDEQLVRASTADMLTELGYQVIEVSSAEEALQALDRGIGIDLLVSDHLMPGMTGTDLARAVRNRLPAMPVLIVSGYAETEEMAPDLPRLTKPFRQSDLAESLSEIVGSGGSRRPRAAPPEA